MIGSSRSTSDSDSGFKRDCANGRWISPKNSAAMAVPATTVLLARLCFARPGCRAARRAAARLGPGGLPSLAQHGQAGCAGSDDEGGPSRGRGSRALMSVAGPRPTVPLDELARCSPTALRSTALRSAPVSCARARSSPRPPATPGAGPPECESQLGPARPPRQSLRLLARRPLQAPTLMNVGGPLAAAVAPAAPSRRPRLLGPSWGAVAAR